MFKHSLLALSLAGLIYAAPAFAQTATPDQSAPNAQQQQWHGHGEMDPAKHTEMLTRKLNLTPDQQTKVQEIFNPSNRKCSPCTAIPPCRAISATKR